MATISLSIYSLSFKSLVTVSWLADCLSIAYTPQSGSIWGPQAQAKVQALKFYKNYLEKKFPNPSTEVLTSKIIELPTENPPSIEVDPLTVTIPTRWADDNDYVVSL